MRFCTVRYRNNHKECTLIQSEPCRQWRRWGQTQQPYQSAATAIVPPFIRPIPSSTEPAECQPLGVTAPQSSTTRRLAPSSRPRFSAWAWCWDLVVCYFDSSSFSSQGRSIFKRDEQCPFKDTIRSSRLSPRAFLQLFQLEFGNVLIFQVAARPRDSLREFQFDD
jgi:hypothetical protein